MFKTTKRTLAVLLAVLMLVFSVPFTSFAEEGESKPETSGTYGAFEWALSDDGVLTVSGSGELSGKDSASSIPWDALREQIKKVLICSGIETIKGANFFSNCPELTTVVFPTSLTYIGANTFKDVTNMPTVYYCGTEQQWADVTNNSTALTAEVLQYHVEHTFNYTPNEDDTHTAVCAICEYQKENLACSGGTATCTEEATCQFCGAKYGEKAAHTESQDWTSDGEQHWKVCSVCGELLGEKVKHVSNAAWVKDGDQHWRTCKVCAAVVGEKVDHTPIDNWKTNGNQHWKTCSVCGLTLGNKENHEASETWTTDDNQHWKVCATCGEIVVAKADHVESEEWTTDGTQHWKVCTECGAVLGEKVNHTPSKKWSTDGDQHWKICTVCNGVVGEKVDHTPIDNWNTSSAQHWKSCSVCSITLDKKENHTASEEWTTDETQHWKVCTTCGAIAVAKANHVESEEWSTDGEQHWKVCTECGAVLGEKVNHTPSTKWSTDGDYHWKICTVCNGVVGEKVAHTENEQWSTNGNQHWKACSVCNMTLGKKENHIESSEWTTDDNQHWKVCTVCDKIVVAAADHNASDTLEKDDNQHWKVCADCGKELTKRTDHDWDYAHAKLKEWSSDLSTCTVTVSCTGCDKTQDITTDWIGKAVTKDPTCQTEGVRTYTATFSNSVIPAQVKSEPIPKTEHVWETSVKFEKQGNTWYAYGTCVNHPLSPIKLAATMEQVTPQDCEAAQTIRYYVELNGVKYTSEVMTGLPAIGHNYQFKGIEWTDSEDTSVAPTAVGKFVCSNDVKHVLTPNASVELVSSKDPGCLTTGENVYSATVTFDNVTYDNIHSVEVPATGHSYGAWTSNGDGTHTRVCTACAEGTEGHSETATCSGGTAACTEKPICDACGAAYGSTLGHSFTKYVSDGNATCTQDGTKTAKCDRCDATNTLPDEGSKLGHNWQFASFAWSADNKTAKVNLVCSNDAKHTEQVDAEMSSEFTDATCEDDAFTVYTAIYGSNTDSKTVTDEGTATDHDWQFVSFIWSADNKTAKVNLVCGNDAKHTKQVDAEMSSEFTDATCENDAFTVYTATYGSNIDRKTVKDEGTATDHDWQFESFVWAEDGTTAKVNLVCDNDAEHSKQVDAEISSEYTPATCEDDAYTTYTATYEGESDENVVTEADTAVGHNWQFESFEWAEDGTTAKVALVCANDESHTTKVDADMSSEYSPATCNEDAYTVYTATYEDEIDENVVYDSDSATGHDWGDWELLDNETHIRYCLNDDEHYQTGDHTIIVYVDSYPDYDYPNLYHCWNVKACSVCGAVLDRSMEYTVVDPDPCEHVYHIDTTITDATCAKEGECIMVCEKCGDKIHDTLSATGNHVDADNSGKCDTCNTKMTGGSHCKYCGKIHGGAFGWLTKFFHSILAIFVR